MSANNQSQPLVMRDDGDADVHAIRVSACMDGQRDGSEVQLLLDAMDSPGDQTLLTWTSYHIIGEVLRGQADVPGGTAPAAFLSEFRERMTKECGQTPSQPVLDTGSAAMVAHTHRVPAANDAVFRWKLVAGLASVAAVMAVAWGVLGVSAPVGSETGVQLADGAPTQGIPLVAQRSSEQPSTSTVVVQTPQGALIRDARLQQLLAEHRQNGLSALQMPAGFLRNATHDGGRSR